MFRLLVLLPAVLLTATACIFPQPCGGGSNDLTCETPAADVVQADYLAVDCTEDPCNEADVTVLEDTVQMVVTDADGNTWRVTWPREGVLAAE